MGISFRKAKKNLKKKGFEERKSKSGQSKKQHHIYYDLIYNGKKAGACTYFSHNAKNQEISNSLIKLMAKQLYLTIKEAKDLLECPMSKADYIKILRNQKPLGFD